MRATITAMITIQPIMPHTTMRRSKSGRSSAGASKEGSYRAVLVPSEVVRDEQIAEFDEVDLGTDGDGMLLHVH